MRICTGTFKPARRLAPFVIEKFGAALATPLKSLSAAPTVKPPALPEDIYICRPGQCKNFKLDENLSTGCHGGFEKDISASDCAFSIAIEMACMHDPSA